MVKVIKKIRRKKMMKEKRMEKERKW